MKTYLNVLFHETIVIVDNGDGRFSHAGQIKVLRMQMILRCNPADVNVSRVLARKYPHAVEIFVHQFHALGIENFITDRFDATSG